MKLINKIRNINYLPVALFLIIVINLFPILIGNMHSLVIYAANVKEMATCLVIELIILSFFLFGRVKKSKEVRNNLIILIISSLVLFTIQCIKLVSGNAEELDFINIACIFINILFLYISVLSIKIEDKYIYNFYRLMLIFGIFASIINLIIYKENILLLFKTISYRNIKSFFSHRNQFAMFLYIAIISNFILMYKSKKIWIKALLSLSFLFLSINIFLSTSRTGIFCTLIFLFLIFITSNIKFRNKFLIIFVGITLILSISMILINKYENVAEYIIDVLENLIIRKNTFKDFTGRTEIWKIGEEKLNENIFNKLFGIGRFSAIKLIDPLGITQFHSFYVESLMTGGFFILLYYCFIYACVIKRILCSNIDKKIKSIYISMYISLGIYAMFESISRFSIGYADTLCLVFFITIPLLHANAYEKEKNNTQVSLFEKIKQLNINNGTSNTLNKIKENLVNFKSTLKNKINIEIILFTVIFINFLPLIIANAFSREAYGVSNGIMVGIFLVEIIVLGVYFMKNYLNNKDKIKRIKQIKVNLIFLIIVTTILMMVQCYNFFIKNLVFMDVLNVGCIFINIVLLYISIYTISSDEKNIYLFFKALIYMTLLSCLINIIIYYKDILGLFKGIYNPGVMIKGFFSNRNQFAFILYLAIISDIFLIEKTNQKRYYVIFAILLFSLFTTMSRTGILMVAILLGLLFLFNKKIKLRTKIITILVFLIIFAISVIMVYNYLPDLWTKINATLIRSYELKDVSGRMAIWQVGIDVLNKNPMNWIFGTGRFKAIQSLDDVDGRTYTQFHNIYIEVLVTGGIMELAFIIYMYYSVIKTLIKSNMNKEYKKVYIASYISYFIYIAFESLGRFSIGAPDTVCFIFFITIPLIHALSIKERDERKK